MSASQCLDPSCTLVSKNDIFDMYLFGKDFYTDIVSIIKGKGNNYVEHNLPEKQMISFFFTKEMLDLAEGSESESDAQFEASKKGQVSLLTKVRVFL